MSYPVVIMPGEMFCGGCRRKLFADQCANDATELVFRCMHHDCERNDVPLVFPLEVRELERVEPK